MTNAEQDSIVFAELREAGELYAVYAELAAIAELATLFSKAQPPPPRTTKNEPLSERYR